MQRREAIESSAPRPRREVRLGGPGDLVWIGPVTAPALLYLHGGGYRMGSASASAWFGERLHEATGRGVALVDYRVAPEHPFPAALHDAAAAFGAVTEETGTPPVLVGDSAGGGLALALSVALRRSAGRLPGGLVLISPWVDLTLAASTFRSRRARDELFSLRAATEAADAYLAGHPADDPLVSPLLADLAGMPPVHVCCGSSEVLLDDTLRLASALALADVEVEAAVAPHMPHVFPIVQPDAPPSAAALERIAAFLERVAPASTQAETV